jgi:hypothetical protein
MSDVGAEVVLAGAYALFLVAVAAGLDLMARLSHERSHRYRTAAFQYHLHLDAWECPEGEYLPRVETDHQQRLARYRARAHVCNGCRVKDDCTDSYAGREIALPIDPWPHSDVGRFHRALAVVLVVLAGLVLCVEVLRHHAPADLAALALPAALTMIVGPRLVAGFIATPSRFPDDGGGQIVSGTISIAPDGHSATHRPQPLQKS